jgi:tetratricopeptide (TPR) repeat protein
MKRNRIQIGLMGLILKGFFQFWGCKLGFVAFLQQPPDPLKGEYIPSNLGRISSFFIQISSLLKVIFSSYLECTPPLGGRGAVAKSRRGAIAKNAQKLSFQLLSFLLVTTQLTAQSLKTYEKAADKAFEQKDYNAAIQYYATILKSDANNSEVRWKYAECARLFMAYAEADKAYLKLSNNKITREKFPMLDLKMGESKKSQGKYEEAKELFTKYINSKNADAENIDKAKALLAANNKALELSKIPSKIEVTHPGKEINSPFSDFGAVVQGDTLYFSSYKFDKKKDTKKPVGKITKMLSSVKGARAREVGRGFPSVDSAHVANGTITPDGKFFFFTFCKNKTISEIRCEIFVSVKDKKDKWTKPQRLPEPINQKGYTSTHPSIETDANGKNRILWFSSDRPGGKGKLDLWSVPLDSAWFCPCMSEHANDKKRPKIPEFPEPKNAELLNTIGNDATPFYHSASQTLYFSNDEGRDGFGGYDIFKAKITKNTFETVENAGAGFNTAYNDLYPFLSEDGKSGWFSSNRPEVIYLDETSKACCNDLFSFKIPEPPKEKTPPIPVATTPINPTNPDPNIPTTNPNNPTPTPTKPQDPIVIVPPQLSDFVGLPLYFDNDEPDKRTKKPTTKQSYEGSVINYLERQQEYRERYSEGLKDAQADQAQNDIDDFFESKVRRGYDRLFQLSDLIISRLLNGEKIEVVIRGFTSPRAKTDYNIFLGKRRISSLRNHFEQYADGVLKTYLLSGQLKITEANFGESTAKTGISDNLADERNSVYSPEAAQERRVEILEIK